MIQLRTAHTADLDAATLEAVRVMLVAAFDDLTSDDWEHALGGMHALAWEDGRVAGHAAVVQRRLLTGGRALRTGYDEAVAVPADRRGCGHGAAVIAAAERVVRGAYEPGALCASQHGAGFYAARLAALARAVRSAHARGSGPHPGRGRRHLRPAGDRDPGPD